MLTSLIVFPLPEEAPTLSSQELDACHCRGILRAKDFQAADVSCLSKQLPCSKADKYKETLLSCGKRKKTKYLGLGQGVGDETVLLLAQNISYSHVFPQIKCPI